MAMSILLTCVIIVLLFAWARERTKKIDAQNTISCLNQTLELKNGIIRCLQKEIIALRRNDELNAGTIINLNNFIAEIKNRPDGFIHITPTPHDEEDCTTSTGDCP